MNVKEFFGKFISRYLLLHFTAMLVVIIAICIGIKYGLEYYTHHGEGIEVPDLYGVDFNRAFLMLNEKQLLIIANDTGYNKRMPANCILTQTPGVGTKVKEGRTIYVTINSDSSPTLAIPDLIDNSSYREAQARLASLGFRLLPPKRIDGERDWVYGIMSGGRSLQTGDKVSIESALTLVIGNGLYEDEDDETLMSDSVMNSNQTDVDEFSEIGD
jgi:beta-lactam-binding protein with PASTA domain